MLKMHHDFRDRRNPGATGFGLDDRDGIG